MRLLLLCLTFCSTFSNGYDPGACPSTETNEEWINDIYEFGIDDLRNICLSKDPWQKQLDKYIYQSDHDIVIRRSSDYLSSDWNISAKGQLERRLFYVMHQNSTFVSTCNVNETQTFISNKADSFIIKREIVNSGFPFADSFKLEVFVCAFSIPENGSTQIIVRHNIKSLSSWYFIVSATVEEGAKEGMIEYYSAFSDALHLYAKERQEALEKEKSEELLRQISAKEGGAISPGNVDARPPMTSFEDSTVAPFLSGMSEADIIENYVQFTDRISVTDGVDVFRIGALLLVVVLVGVLLLAHKKLFSMVRTVPQMPLAVITMKNLDTDPLLTGRSAASPPAAKPPQPSPS